MKDTFIIYTESKELVDELSVHQKAALLDALFFYASNDDIDLSELDLTTRIVFKTMRMKIDAANERYEEKCRVNKENGTKGGRPKTERFSTETEKTERLFSETEKTLPDTDTDTEPDTEPEEKRKAPTEPKEKVRLKAGFDEAWEAYPRKQGKKQAEAAYHRAIKKGTQHEEIMAGIVAYKAYLTASNTPLQYIKQGSAFFNQEAWNDDWSSVGYSRTKEAAPRHSPPAYKPSSQYDGMFERERAIKADQEIFKTDYGDLSKVDYSKLLQKGDTG